MRFFWGGILFVLGVGVLGTELRMLNGDQLQGEIVGVENGRLRFLPAWETTPLEIPAKYVGELLFASEESDLRKNAFDARIVLGNLDEFEADILEMDEEHARVRMPWGRGCRGTTCGWIKGIGTRCGWTRYLSRGRA